MSKKKPAWPRLIEISLGAVRQVMEERGGEGYLPVGFGIMFYHPDRKEWCSAMDPICDSKNPDLYEAKLRGRINLCNEFIASMIKKILEGYLDEMAVNKEEIEGFGYQIPGMKGRA